MYQIGQHESQRNVNVPIGSAADKYCGSALHPRWTTSTLTISLESPNRDRLPTLTLHRWVKDTHLFPMAGPRRMLQPSCRLLIPCKIYTYMSAAKYQSRLVASSFRCIYIILPFNFSPAMARTGRYKWGIENSVLGLQVST